MSDDKNTQTPPLTDPQNKTDNDGIDELADLKQKCEEYLNGWKRAQADYQNLQKEVAKEKGQIVRSANEYLLIELLPILDNFKLALGQIPEGDMDSAWVVGFSHIKKQLEVLVAGYGVEEIKTIGQKFDANLHEAIEKQVDLEKEDGVILAERRPGYMLNGKVIQAARVVVNQKNDK